MNHLPPDLGVDAPSARGLLRGALTALQNLLALVRSPKVGPKAIRPVLPEVKQAVDRLGAPLRAALTATFGTPRDVAAVGELASYIAGRAARVIAAIDAAAATGVDARSRLALEHETAARVPEIDGARFLVEMLAALEDNPVEVDLPELLNETFAPTSVVVACGSVVNVCLAPPDGRLTVLVRPRVAMSLVLAAVAHVYGAHDRRPAVTPHVRVRRSPVVGYVEIGPSTGDPNERAAVHVARLPPWLPPTDAVVALVASYADAEARFSTSEPRALLGFENVGSGLGARSPLPPGAAPARAEADAVDDAGSTAPPEASTAPPISHERPRRR